MKQDRVELHISQRGERLRRGVVANKRLVSIPRKLPACWTWEMTMRGDQGSLPLVPVPTLPRATWNLVCSRPPVRDCIRQFVLDPLLQPVYPSAHSAGGVTVCEMPTASTTLMFILWTRPSVSQRIRGADLPGPEATTYPPSPSQSRFWFYKCSCSKKIYK
jgi:hypothetical protein